VGQHLTAGKGLNAPGLQQRHLLGIAQLRVRLVLQHAREKGELW
jgi:hypothetical protein